MNSQNHPLKKWKFKVLVATAAFCLIGCAAWSQTATVSVNAASVLAQVPPEGYGVNAAIYDADVISSELPATFEAGGITAVRYPGGSYSDCYHWQADKGTPAAGTGYPGCSLYITPGATFESFMTTDVNPAGAHAIVVVNYGSNIAGTGGGEPSEAAAWVQYANVTNNWGVEYWEIGNEVGGNGYFGNPGWEFDLHYPYNGDREGQPALSPTAYAENTLAYISAMKAVDPNIKIGVGVWCPDTNNNNPLLFNVLASKLDFLIVHWYPGSAALSAEASLASDVANVRNQIAAAGGNRNIPFAITETNADGAFSTAMDAVWNIDNYLTWFENGAVNVDYWELFDSDGVLSSPTSPLDPYYAIQFSNTIAGVGDNLVSTSSSNSLVRSHAVTRSDGSVGILLLNENSSNATVSVSISGATVSSSGTLYTLNASSGTTSSSISGIGNNFSVTVPGSSAIAVVIPATTSCEPTPINPQMNVGGVWTAESFATVSSTTAVVDLGPQPLTGGSWSWTGPNGFKSTLREIDSIPLYAGTNTYTATYTNGCGDKSTQAFTITVTSPSGSFTLKPSASTLPITKGGSGTDPITVTDVSPFSGSVTLAASGLPSGVTAAFGTNPTTGSSVLTLTASSSATAGASTVTITGTSGTLTASTTIALTVSPGSSFTIAASASTLAITQGSSGTDTITVTDMGGFTGSVTLATSGLPGGVTAAFGTNPATGPSVLTLTASPTATAGTSTVTITGMSGSLSWTTTIALTVTPKTTGSAACAVDYTITPQNNTAFGAALTIVNNSNTAWTSWTLTWTFANGQTFQSLWNGIETQSGANVTVTNENYNGTVAAGGSVTGVGFNGNWNGITNAVPTNFAINGTTCTVN